MNLKDKNKLLYSRAGFGISPIRLDAPLSVKEAVDGLFPKGAPSPMAFITEKEYLEYGPKARKMENDPEKVKEMRKEFRQHIKDINLLWMQEMVKTDYPLLEKTALFWHGHFATKIGNSYFDQGLLNIIRGNALGSFADMLKQVSKSAAMLQFLNNRQNKKEHPNENFAREVMELFTLGRGHYTEQDIKEAARAFTGWSYDEYGEFVFRQRQHDEGHKTFLGQSGFFSGDDILDMLLKDRQTATFITQKIYRYFVSDERTDEKHIKELAAEFYDSNYDIANLLKSIFNADWFYKENIVGGKIKAPVELLVGYQRLLPLTFTDNRILINLQRGLGQYLFEPPNVAGWPGGKSWIDSSSLILRMRLPEALLSSKEIDLSPKEPDPEMAESHVAMSTSHPVDGKYRVGKVDADWSNYLAYWKKYQTEELPEALADYLLTMPIDKDQLKQLMAFADKDNKDDLIKSVTILLMGLPEYQLS